ncbi:OmpA family protein [Pseudidiomarina halophila]|uniref:OmpA family protein n=1 Tax=Pseudidiomarina halophila TaxID=1449799 RepID=UPI00360772B4
MKTNKITQAMTVLFLAGVALPAVAQEQDGWYLGVGGGATRATIAEDEITADLMNSGYQVTEFDAAENDSGYKIFAGYQFNQNFALEAGYFDLGNFSYDATTSPAGMKSGQLDLNGWNMDFIGLLPVSESGSLFALVGAHKSEAEVHFAGTGAVNVLTPNYAKTTTDYKFGVGYQYQLGEHFGLRLAAERYRMDDAVGNDGDIDLYSVSLVFRLGGGGHAPGPATQAAALAAQAPVVAPAPVAATEQYCSSLEIEFEIANNDIQRVNQERMRVLATFLESYPETNAVIEGHTDNVGTEADNLKLSQQRAQAAVDYLVREHAIDRDRLTAVGFGETQPVADNSTTAGKQKNRRIHAVIGCATGIEGLEPLPARVTLAMELEFDTNDATIAPKYYDELDSIGEYLQTNPELSATLEGHTDNASPEVAQQISRARAQSVADYLVSHFAIDRSRLNVQGYGSTRRDTYNATASERQDNRRVNIIISYPK